MYMMIYFMTRGTRSDVDIQWGPYPEYDIKILISLFARNLYTYTLTLYMYPYSKKG